MYRYNTIQYACVLNQIKLIHLAMHSYIGFIDLDLAKKREQLSVWNSLSTLLGTNKMLLSPNQSTVAKHPETAIIINSTDTVTVWHTGFLTLGHSWAFAHSWSSLMNQSIFVYLMERLDYNCHRHNWDLQRRSKMVKASFRSCRVQNQFAV